MKRTNRLRMFTTTLLLAALLSSCLNRPAPLDCRSEKDFCIGLVTQQGKLNDYKLNQLAWDGIQKAEQKLGAYVKYIETVDSRDYEKNIATFANAGYDLIVTVGYEQNKATLASAEKYPQVKFIGVDQPFDHEKTLPRNIVGLSFAEDQLGFLAGVLATQMTRTRKVGAVCGPDSFSPAWRYCEGFKAGVSYINFPPTPTPEPTETPSASDTPDPAATLDPNATPEPTLEDSPTFVEETAESFEEESTSEDENSGEESDDELDEEETPEEFSSQRPQTKQRALQAGQDELPTETPTPTLEFPVDGATPVGTPSATETPIVEAIAVYHNDLGFGESMDDPEWDASTANALIDNNVDVVFGSNSYEENGAISAAAKRRKYAIGVNTDQYFTILDAQPMLVSSVVKQIAENLYSLIRQTKNGDFPQGNILGTVGYAPYHDMIGHIQASTRNKLSEIQQALAQGDIETDVLWRKPETPDEADAPTEPEPPSEEPPVEEEP